jgi:hypothetical protein
VLVRNGLDRASVLGGALNRGNELAATGGEAMRTISRWLVLLLLPIATACGGGSSSVVTDGGNSLGAGFVPAQPSPGSNTAAMGTGTYGGSTVGIQVTVTDTNAVYGASFRVDYDSTRVQYVGWSPGLLLEQGGQHPTYQVDGHTSGTVFVGASRTGNAPAVNVTSTETLIVLNFRVLQPGDTPLQFADEQLYNGQVPPQSLSGIHWFGGTVNAN